MAGLKIALVHNFKAYPAEFLYPGSINDVFTTIHEMTTTPSGARLTA